MKTPLYIVESSFFVPEHSQKNWDADREHCLEGIGIPTSFLRRLKERNSKFNILVRSTGIIYETHKSDVLAHNERWNTFKTAPHFSDKKFMIVPVSILRESGFCPQETPRLRILKRMQEKREHEFQRRGFQLSFTASA